PLSFLMLPPPPRAPLFPYTTLFRSAGAAPRQPPAAAPDARPSSVASSGSPFGANRIRYRDLARSRPRNEVNLVVQKFGGTSVARSEEHTSELQSLRHLVCRLLLEKK